MKNKLLLTVLVLAFGLTGCVQPATPPTPTVMVPEPTVGMPNPAAVYCEEQGYTVEIRTDENGGQYGVCIFPEGSECDEWTYYRGECSPGDSLAPTAAAALTPTKTPTPAPTSLPTVVGGYATWLRYTHADYGFSFQYPPDWVVEPDDSPASTLYGHALFVRPADESARVSLRVVFRRADEDILLWPTGVGEGEFVERGSVAFIGGTLKRVVLVCEGRDQSVWYESVTGDETQRGGLELSLILAYRGACSDGYSLPEQVQAMGNMIVTSFEIHTND
jgi:putative hemolysin